MAYAAVRDKLGNAWPLTLTVRTVRDVRAATGFDPLGLIEPGKAEALTADCVLLGRVLYHATRPAGLTEDDFLERLDDEALETGFLALVESLADFSAPPRRGILQTLAAALKRHAEAARLEPPPPEIAAAIAAAMEPPPPNAGAPSTAPPGSPGSTQAT